MIAIGYAGSINYVKYRHKVLPRAWELLDVIKELKKSTSKEIRVVYVGKGTALNRLREMAIEKGVINSVSFEGYVPEEEYLKKLRSFDICFYESVDSYAYNFMTGMKLQEYSILGKPVIAGDIGEAHELLNGLGFTVNPIDFDLKDTSRYVKDIVRKITEILSDPKLDEKLVILKKRAFDNYSDEIIIRKLETLYRKVSKDEI
jgi:glycosyltransferase involved in cell wall biosynthesis